jgi:hypothetical protein
MPEKINSKREIIYFDSWFLRVQSMVAWLQGGKSVWWSFLLHGGQKVERAEGTVDQV